MNGLSSHALSRRSLLKRGAIVGGATVWVVPVVQAFSMTSAHADTPSGAVVSPTPPPKKITPSHGVDGTTIHSKSSHGSGPSSHGVDAISAHTVKAAGAKNASAPAGLANTGVPVVDLLAAGVGAIVLGGAATAAGRRKRPMPPRTH